MPEARYTFRNDYSGGQNDTNSELKVRKDEAKSARNVDIRRDGAFSKRSGADQLNATPVSGEIGLIHQFRPSASSTKLVVAHGTRVDEWNGADTFTQIITGLTADQIFLVSPLRNILYLMNRLDNPMVYWPDAPAGPPKIYRPGAPTPTGALTDGGDIAGDVGAGSFWARLRFVEVFDDTFFGEPHGTPIQLTSLAARGRKLSGIATGPQYSGNGNPDYYITKRVVERTLLGGDVGGPYYLDGYINDNTTTSYDFVDSDAQLLEKDLAPFDGARLPFPKLWPFIVDGDRVVGHDPSDPGSILWSEIDEFGIISSFNPESNQVYLKIEDIGDQPVAVSKLGKFIVWWCGRSIHIMAIDAGGNAYTERVTGHKLGFPSARCVIDDLPGGNIVWSFKGPHIFDGTSLIFIGEKIQETISLIPKTNLAGMFSVHRSQELRRQAKFVFPLSGAHNNFAAKYHYRKAVLSQQADAHSWTFDDAFEAKSGAIVLDVVTNEEIEYSGNYAGKVFREDFSSINDHDANSLIPASWETGWDDMDDARWVKQFEGLWIFLTGLPPKSIIVSWETEFGRGVSGTRVVDVEDVDVAKYDTDDLYDVARYAGAAGKIAYLDLANDGAVPYGRFLKLLFQNDAQGQDFTIMGHLVKWSPDSDRFNEQS